MRKMKPVFENLGFVEYQIEENADSTREEALKRIKEIGEYIQKLESCIIKENGYSKLAEIIEEIIENEAVQDKEK